MSGPGRITTTSGETALHSSQITVAIRRQSDGTREETIYVDFH
ncbi:hypothetical protein [Qipengyuania sp. ASV99]